MLSRSSSAYQPLDSSATSAYSQHNSSSNRASYQTTASPEMKDTQQQPQRQHSSRRKTKKLSRENAMTSNGNGSTDLPGAQRGAPRGATTSLELADHLTPLSAATTTDVHEMTSIAVISSVTGGVGGGGSSGPFRGSGGGGPNQSNVICTAVPVSAGNAGTIIRISWLHFQMLPSSVLKLASLVGIVCTQCGSQKRSDCG